MNYTYSYYSIIKALVSRLCFRDTSGLISKVINPNVVSSGSQNATWTNIINDFVDVDRIISKLPPIQEYIIRGIIEGYTQKDMASYIGCSQQNISKHKNRIKIELKKVQIYE